MRIAQHLLLASLVLGSAISAAAQSDAVPTTPTDWLLYRDEVNGISFRYPPDLRVISTPATDSSYGLLLSVDLYSGHQFD